MTGTENVVSENEFQELDDRITLEALESVFQRIPQASYPLILFPVIVISIMWSQADHHLLIGWCVAVLISISIRYGVAKAFLRGDVHYNDAIKWGRRFTLCSLFSGITWSAFVLLFFISESVEHLVFVITVSISLSTGAIVAGGYWLPAYYVFSVPVMVSLALRFFMEGSFSYIALGVLVLWALIGTLGLAKELNKSMRSEMRLRHKSLELAQALKKKTEEAQKATLAKSKFLAAASHDLRQPLHTLALFFDVLKESNSDRERENIFPRIELSLDALKKLFDALLDISKLDAEVVKPQISHFDLSKLLSALADEFEQDARDKNLELIVHGKASIVMSDRLLLERILRNLIGNAIRYTEKGSILLSVRTRGKTILLQVWDTGIGIPEESIEEVFVEFQQLHNAHRDRTQGLGLGLALVQRLCRLMNLPLELRSQPGKGSVFCINIPKGSASLLAQNEAVPSTHSWDLSGRRILVIDDEQNVLDAMNTLLSKWGCDVVCSESLEEAVSKLKKEHFKPELLLSDLRLRDNKTGIEALDSLRKVLGSSVPGIIITGDTAAEQIKKANDSGYELLQKPIRPAHLRSIIQHHLSDSAS